MMGSYCSEPNNSARDTWLIGMSIRQWHHMLTCLMALSVGPNRTAIIMVTTFPCAASRNWPRLGEDISRSSDLLHTHAKLPICKSVEWLCLLSFWILRTHSVTGWRRDLRQRAYGIFEHFCSAMFYRSGSSKPRFSLTEQKVYKGESNFSKRRDSFGLLRVSPLFFYPASRLPSCLMFALSSVERAHRITPARPQS